MMSRMDNHGYPTLEYLTEIREWPALKPEDARGLMEVVAENWHFASDVTGEIARDVWWLPTGGWSGNEDVIGVLKEKPLFWMMYWRASMSGGVHVFETRPLSMDRSIPSKSMVYAQLRDLGFDS